MPRVPSGRADQAEGLFFVALRAAQTYILEAVAKSMSVDAELFHMLIERLGGVEDEVRRMRSDLGCILLPRLQDVTADNVNDLKDRLKEQDVVRGLAGRVHHDHAFFSQRLSNEHVHQLKANGFRVSQAKDHTHKDITTAIMWGGAALDAPMLQHHWINPEDFKEL